MSPDQITKQVAKIKAAFHELANVAEDKTAIRVAALPEAIILEAYIEELDSQIAEFKAKTVSDIKEEIETDKILEESLSMLQGFFEITERGENVVAAIRRVRDVLKLRQKQLLALIEFSPAPGTEI